MPSFSCSNCGNLRACWGQVSPIRQRPCVGLHRDTPSAVSRLCQARAAPWSEHQDSTGDSMSLSDLKQQLDIAVSEESFGEAARLRDRIQEISHDVRAAVDYANTRFYEAFKGADSDAMADAWGDGDSVQCIHPGMAALIGREKVLQGWSMIFRGKKGMQIRISNVRVAAAGNMGFVTCEEHVGTDDRKGNVIVTNVFEKQGETWKIVHHHGSIVSPAVNSGGTR